MPSHLRCPAGGTPPRRAAGRREPPPPDDDSVALESPAPAFAGREDAVARRVATYATQPQHPEAPAYAPKGGRDLLYLDVWERHVTVLEDREIREVALGGPDTATRVETVCQVRVAEGAGSCAAVADLAAGPVRARLSTMTLGSLPEDDPCTMAPSGGYRGLENRLYRVEVHTTGDLGAATFEWSRDNRAVAYSVDELPEGRPEHVRLTTLGRTGFLSRLRALSLPGRGRRAYSRRSR